MKIHASKKKDVMQTAAPIATGNSRLSLFRFRPLRCIAPALLALTGILACGNVQAQDAPDPLWLSTGHTAAAHTVAFSPDGAIMATGSDDRTIKLWRSADGMLLRTLSGHTDAIRAVAFSLDGSTLA